MFTRDLHSLTLLSIVLGIWISPALAQETTGRLEGYVVDAKGEPIASVNVVATGPALQGTRGTQTDEAGHFVLLALAVGEYTVKFSQMGYQPYLLEDVQIQLGQTRTLGTLRLEEQVYQMEEVTVSGRAPPVDPASTAYGENLSAREFRQLPIERDYKSVAVLLPHANASTLGDPVNFAGATGLENRYFVDGIDVTDPFRSATGTRLPYNFVQEVQVKTGGYEAEQHSSLGGTVNAVTHSGGNRVSGQVFGFFTSNGLSATPRSIPGAPNKGLSYSLYDAGFGIGGPIVKDRLWYSGAYNPSISSEDVVIPGWGSYQDRRHIHSFAAKLTWRADARNTFVLTGLGDPTTGRRVSPPVNRPAGIDPFLSDVREGGVAGIVEGRHVMRDHLLLQTSLSRSYRAENQTPETELGRTADFFIDSAGVASGGGFRQKNESGVTTASLHATWLGRDQEVKAGIEYRDTRLDFDTRYVILAQASATSYYYQLASFKGHVGSRLPSAFLQHSWHPTERITVSDGMRWEGEHWISSQGRVAQTILDEWQPRIGLTYQPGRLGTQKVEGSFGRYYQSITTAPLFWYYNANSLFYSASYDHDPRVDPAGADTIGYGGGAIQPRLIGLQGQFFDEFALGYELQIGSRMKFSVRGIERILRKGIEDGIDLQTFAIGLSNPGLGVLHAFPAMTRRYSAIELSWLGQIGKDVSLLGSYVLSRNFGNHEGLFDSRLNNPYPNATGLYDVLDQMANSSGLLPNDRTHVFKLAGSYRAGGGVTLGWAGLVESGMPVSEFGGTAVGPPYGGFIGARGSHGRTPAIWDLNLRLGYEPRFAAGGRFHPALTVDGLHVASQRRAVRYDEVHYRTLDSSGNESDPNPNYRTPTAFQPPMEIRLGLELSF